MERLSRKLRMKVQLLLLRRMQMRARPLLHRNKKLRSQQKRAKRKTKQKIKVPRSSISQRKGRPCNIRPSRSLLPRRNRKFRRLQRRNRWLRMTSMVVSIKMTTMTKRKRV